jgi:predicted TPR repeat methyltransferase
MPLDQAIGRALHLTRLGKHREAEAAFAAVLARAPRHPHALHFHGMCLFGLGRVREAIERLELAAEVSPSDLDVQNNLANVYLHDGRIDQAEKTFRALLAVAPDAASARFNLGVLLSRTGRFDESIDELRRVHAMGPDPDVSSELGRALFESKRFEEAVEAYREAVALAPGDADLKRRCSRAYFHLIDRLDRTLAPPAVAIPHLRDWVALDPDDAVARHTLAAYSGKNVPTRCSDDYVRTTFDLFAASFDDVLATIRYRGVERTAAALLSWLEARGGEAVIVDVGCGTGALGPLVRARASKLVGVDLAPKMVERARARGAYDEVDEAEIVSWLEARPSSCDAVACADTVIYFGEVEPLFRAAIGALRPGGVFVLTAETLDGGAERFHLDRHGRYAHALSYLRTSLEEAGADVVATEALDAIRVEYGADVPGLVLTAVRRLSA